jgi:hypothetical protein
VLLEIDELTNPKPKAGKKSLTPEQANLKSATLALLESQRDDSDAEHPVRLVLEPRTSKVEAQELMDFLLAHTSMEAKCPMNLVAIGRDGRPRQMGLSRSSPSGPRSASTCSSGASSTARTRSPTASTSRRPDDRLPQHRQGDQGHPQFRRAQARPRQGFQASERQAEDILEIACASSRAWKASGSSAS